MISESLNLSGIDFCKKLGVTHHGDILKELRKFKLVRFFKIGNKYLYPTEDAKKVSEKLQKGEISIKTDKGYYITLNT